MLTTLRIRNLALVEDLTLELEPGYNAITGETGAGKSILIGALTLLLGGRADRTLLRAGSDACTVEAVFDLRRLKPDLGPLLAAHGLEPPNSPDLILKRSLSAGGANRQFVNGSPATLAALAALGDELVDIHGPHEHQSLLQPARQLANLDAFGALGARRAAVADLVRRRQALGAARAALVVDDQTYARQLELLRHQVREIEAARLRPEEDEDLQREHQRASNAARLLELGRGALGLLHDDDNALVNQAGALGRLLQELRRLDPDAACLLSLHEQAVSALRDLHSDLAHYVDRVDLDPERLGQLEERLNLLQSLQRKYGRTGADVIAFGERAALELQALEGRAAELARLDHELAEVEAALRREATALSAARRAVVPELTRAVARELGDLGFGQARFDITLTSNPAQPSASGIDTIEFQFAPNPGEPARPLRAIASSGELARVMLALKTVLADQDEIPVLVFDEVDSNVGGETAGAVGGKLRAIGRRRQVLCITHLAPVAACATAHYVVTKETRLLRTVTRLRRLDGPDRVPELARMLGGRDEAARRHAAALLAKAQPPV